MSTTQPPQDNFPSYPPQQGGYPPPAQQQPGSTPPQGYPPYPPQYGGYPPYYPPQPPKRNTNVLAIVLGIIAVLAIGALVVVLAVPSVRAAIFPPEATATLQPTVRPTNTLVPTQKPLPTQPPMPTAAPVRDYSNIGFTSGTLPTGFEVLTEGEAASMGLDVSSFATAISAFTDAPIEAVSVGLNTDPDAFQVVVAVVAAPLTSSEQSLFDTGISDPETAADQFAIGMGSGASAWVMSGGDTIGDSSLGLGLTMTSGGVNMGGEVIVARRGDALQMVIYLYLEGATQQVTALNLADAIDYQIQQVQK